MIFAKKINANIVLLSASYYCCNNRKVLCEQKRHDHFVAEIADDVTIIYRSKEDYQRKCNIFKTEGIIYISVG